MTGCEIGVSWLAVAGAVGLVFGFLVGAIHATAKAERMIRGGKPRVRL